jgi:hypothetical protein
VSTKTKRPLSERLHRFRRRDRRRRFSLPGLPQRDGRDPVDATLALDLEAIGTRAARFFMVESSDYIRRHVETIQIKSASFGRRRLTVDVQLPNDPELGINLEGGRSLFWVPVTSIAKRPISSNIDLCDERGRAVPLLTRHENAAISRAAAAAAIKELLDIEAVPPLLSDLIRELIDADGVAADVPLVLASAGLRREGVDLGKGPGAALADALRVLSGNSKLWIPLIGRPGERRILKFRYDIEFTQVGLRRERPRTLRFLVHAEASGITYPLDLPRRGDRNSYTPPRRVLARLTAAIGFGSVDFGVESPYLSGGDTYHIQVSSPPGVETRAIDLVADLEAATHNEKREQSHGVHLYLDHPRLAPDSDRYFLVALRIGRRGFMTLCWLSAMLTAGLLWLFEAAGEISIRSDEAAAATLLLGPALLSVVVVRPGEHPVASKLFSGVRFLVALNGLLALSAAAAIAGATPFHWTLDKTWLIYSIIASAIAFVVSLSWILSWDTTYELARAVRRWWRSGRAYRLSCAGLTAIVAIVLYLGAKAPQLTSESLYLGLLAILVFPSAFASASHARLTPTSGRLAWFLASYATLLAAAGTVALIVDLAHPWSWARLAPELAIAGLLGAIVLFLEDLRIARQKRKLRSAEQDSAPAPQKAQP